MAMRRSSPAFAAIPAAAAIAFASLGAQASAGAPSSSIRERAIALFAEGRLADSKNMLLPLGGRPRDPIAAYYLGRIALEQDSADLASKWFEIAKEALDTNAAFHLWVARALGARAKTASMFRAPMLGRQGKAELDRALALDPANEDARVELIHFLAVAPRIVGGDVGRARLEAEQLQSASPYRGGLQRGWIEERAGNSREAERAYRGVIAAFPDSTSPRIACVVLIESANRYDEAFVLIDERLRRAPTDFSMLYQMGRLAAISGNWQDLGTKALQQFLNGPLSETRPQVGAAHWRLGMLAERRGEPLVARREYQLAIQLDSTLEEPRLALRRMSPK